MDYEKTFDNKDDNEQPISDWLSDYLDNNFKYLMKKYNTFVDVLIINIDDEAQTVGYLMVMN